MGTYLLYYLVILPVSYLPFPILYLLSDLIFFVVYRVMGYRRKVVFNNIKKSFPEKSRAELKAIEKEFYHHLADLMVESFKTFNISAATSLKRMKVKNAELINKFQREGKSIVTVGGHNGNWELYAVACALQIEHAAIALYTPLTNKFFDKLMRQSRSRFGLTMIATSKKEELLANLKEPSMFIFGIDQCPGKNQRAYWTQFLNQETGVQFGAEKFARDHDMPVVFGNIVKVKRGFYEIEYELICEDPTTLSSGQILEKATRLLETKIMEQPSYWLWSHKRWKHDRCDYEDQKKQSEVPEPSLSQ